MALTKVSMELLEGVTSTAAELNILDTVTATAAELNYLDITTLGLTQASKAVTADANGVVTLNAGIKEKIVNVASSATPTFNLQDSTVFTMTLAHNITTFTWSNPTTGSSSFIFKLIQDGTGSRSITWPTSVDWAAGTAPELSTAAGSVDIFVFFTANTGTDWHGFTAGQAMATP